jgi:hypothetical protein
MPLSPSPRHQAGTSSSRSCPLLVTAAGLRLQTLLAVEGPARMLPDVQQRLADPARRERVLAAVRRVETEPSLLGASSHLLAVAHR